MFRKSGLLKVLFLVCALLCGQLSPAFAQDQDPDALFEQELLVRLAAINPEAVPVFQQATQAYHGNDYEACKAGFEAVLALAPDFPDFNAQVNYEIEQSRHSHSRLHNLYALSNPPLEDWEQKLLLAEEEAFNRLPSAYDTHPSPSERFRLVEKYGIAHLAPSFDDHRPAWELLPNAALLQEEMTGRVQVNVDDQSDETEEEPEE